MSHARAAAEKLSRSRRAMLGAALLGSMALLAIFADVVASPAPLFAWGPRGVEVLPARTRSAEVTGRSAEEIAARYQGAVVVWPIVRHGPLEATGAGPQASASRQHPLGTDARDRDVVARLSHGARTALGLAFSAVLLSMVLGVALGGLAGTYRGFWDNRLVRLVETVDTFPAILVVLIVRAVEQTPSALALVIAVACVRWAEVARLVRAEVLRATTEEYVMAARALGGSPFRVFWRHVLPNALGPVVVSSVFGVASVVLLEAAVSFLEVGAASHAPSWGEMLAQAAHHPEELRLLLAPGLALLVTLGGSYLLADALRDAFDPRIGPPAPAPRPPALDSIRQEREQ